MRCDAFSRAGNVSIPDRIKSPHIATSRHYGHIPITQANPQKQAQPSPTLPAANGIVCPPTPTPTGNANGQAKKVAGNVLFLLPHWYLFRYTLTRAAHVSALAGISHSRLT
jgi:hypothetical protein